MAARPVIPRVMSAVRLLGHGGVEQLEYREDVPVPVPGRGEVLVRVHAAGVNNTDVNTRIGWYSKSVTGATATTVTVAGRSSRRRRVERGALCFPADPGRRRLRSHRGRR